MYSSKKIFEKKLPHRCEFFSFLKVECINQKDYLRVINVWNVFKMNAMGEYKVLYLKTNVLVLAYVFEIPVSAYLEYYG